MSNRQRGSYVLMLAAMLCALVALVLTGLT